MIDLMSPFPKILSKQHVDLLFEPQLEAQSSAATALRNSITEFGDPCGIPRGTLNPRVNWSMSGLVVEDFLSLSHFPAGTVTWSGMPNVIWAVNREKGLGMIFATQLHPFDDEKTTELARLFFREAWDEFA
jgi:hypothetical protein